MDTEAGSSRKSETVKRQTAAGTRPGEEDRVGIWGRKYMVPRMSMAERQQEIRGLMKDSGWFSSMAMIQVEREGKEE